MPTKKQKIANRAKLNKAIRQFFKSTEHQEIQTPSFVVHPDIEPTLTHFETKMQTLQGQEIAGALITSPEYSHKKIISEEIPKIFELAKVFRNNEPLDNRHSTEFTMLEWYTHNQTFQEGIEETKKLIEHTAKVFEKELLPWKYFTVEELMNKFCKTGPLNNPSKTQYKQALSALNIDYQQEDSISDLFQRLFLNCVQPKIDALPNPVIVAYYPNHEATLAKINKEQMAERFEIYIDGLEICNAYGELTDPNEQRKRFKQEQKQRAEQGKTVFRIDEELLLALSRLKKPIFGNALGVDRLLMFLTGYSSIEDTQIFPAHQLTKKLKE